MSSLHKAAVLAVIREEDHHTEVLVVAVARMAALTVVEQRFLGAAFLGTVGKPPQTLVAVEGVD